MWNRNLLKVENLENRICLSVTASVDDGDLIVEGDADGAVEIVAIGNGTYQVIDNGVIVADTDVLQGVDDDIRIELEDQNLGTNDDVTVNLGTEAVDRVFADLGDGDNSFAITGGTATGVVYRGGDGTDAVNIGATVESWAFVKLGDGDNSLDVGGQIGRLFVHGGDDTDLVTVTDTATIESVSARLGSGDNTYAQDGTVSSRLRVSGRDGNDTVSLGSTAIVDGNVRVRLGDGDNQLTVDGAIGGSLKYRGGDGDDQIVVSDDAIIGGNFYAKLGDVSETGNSVAHTGVIDGDFSAISANEGDLIDVENGTIGGETNVAVGEQTRGFYRFIAGRGRMFQSFGRGFGERGSAGKL